MKTIYSHGPGGCMKGTGTVTVPQLSVSMLPLERLGVDVKLFLLSCCCWWWCCWPTGPLHPGSSLPSWMTTRLRFSLPPGLVLLSGVEVDSLFTSLIGVHMDEGRSLRVIAGMSGLTANLSAIESFTGVFVVALSVAGLPSKRLT